MSLRAYQTAATNAETPRETEYRLFAQVTRALMEAAQTDPSDLSRRMDALPLLDKALRSGTCTMVFSAGLPGRPSTSNPSDS